MRRGGGGGEANRGVAWVRRGYKAWLEPGWKADSKPRRRARGVPGAWPGSVAKNEQLTQSGPGGQGPPRRRGPGKEGGSGRSQSLETWRAEASRRGSESGWPRRRGSGRGCVALGRGQAQGTGPRKPQRRGFRGGEGKGDGESRGRDRDGGYVWGVKSLDGCSQGQRSSRRQSGVASAERD